MLHIVTVTVYYSNFVSHIFSCLQKTHELSTNQLVVKVDGWMKLSNVTVDRVGVYFRHAQPDVTQAKGLMGVSTEPDIILNQKSHRPKISWGLVLNQTSH